MFEGDMRRTADKSVREDLHPDLLNFITEYVCSHFTRIDLPFSGHMSAAESTKHFFPFPKWLTFFGGSVEYHKAGLGCCIPGCATLGKTASLLLQFS
jgi:hypothetical protein